MLKIRYSCTNNISKIIHNPNKNLIDKLLIVIREQINYFVTLEIKATAS